MIARSIMRQAIRFLTIIRPVCSRKRWPIGRLIHTDTKGAGGRLEAAAILPIINPGGEHEAYGPTSGFPSKHHTPLEIRLQAFFTHHRTDAPRASVYLHNISVALLEAVLNPNFDPATCHIYLSWPGTIFRLPRRFRENAMFLHGHVLQHSTGSRSEGLGRENLPSPDPVRCTQ